MFVESVLNKNLKSHASGVVKLAYNKTLLFPFIVLSPVTKNPVYLLNVTSRYISSTLCGLYSFLQPFTPFETCWKSYSKLMEVKKKNKKNCKVANQDEQTTTFCLISALQCPNLIGFRAMQYKKIIHQGASLCVIKHRLDSTVLSLGPNLLRYFLQ